MYKKSPAVKLIDDKRVRMKMNLDIEENFLLQLFTQQTANLIEISDWNA